jgi:NADH:ubiquinone oxidoreductase subunit 4 (subunit M)
MVLLDQECGAPGARHYGYMLAVYGTIAVLFFCRDLCSFYLSYELLVGLVFITMYATANSRGGVEALLFFAGWAVVGSFMVGAALLYVIVCAQACEMAAVASFHFSSDELYYLYVFLFFGIGTKLSTWPLWYWLPRAHVEVSTGMSIFLSCILIKVCFFALVRLLSTLRGDLVILPFAAVAALSVFDLTLRLSAQTDLKAITAYGSVLHVNLLLLLFLLDASTPSVGLLLYVWGHSYATAGAFVAISLAERALGARSTVECAGLYAVSTAAALVCAAALVTFLEFPLCFFFWGELWLWALVLEALPAAGAVLMVVGAGLYLIVYFRLWWGVLFGGPARGGALPRPALSFEEWALCAYLLVFQFAAGLQPNLLGFYVFN